MSEYIMDLRKIVGHRPLLQVGASVIVEDAQGRILLQKRADNHCWGYAGGSVELDEIVEDAARRELLEETGIRAEAEEFELLTTVRERNIFYDHYCLCRQVPLHQIRLQPGETDGVRWATFEEVHELIRRKEICNVIAAQFLHEEPELRKRQTAQ